METLAAGDVVVVYFPFSDLSRTKPRPAVVLANAGHSDFVLCQITSKGYSDADAVTLDKDAFLTGALQRVSFVRPAKLFTADLSLITGRVGRLHHEIHHTVVEAVVQVLRRELKP